MNARVLTVTNLGMTRRRAKASTIVTLWDEEGVLTVVSQLARTSDSAIPLVSVGTVTRKTLWMAYAVTLTSAMKILTGVVLGFVITEWVTMTVPVPKDTEQDTKTANRHARIKTNAVVTDPPTVERPDVLTLPEAMFVSANLDISSTKHRKPVKMTMNAPRAPVDVIRFALTQTVPSVAAVIRDFSWIAMAKPAGT